MKILSIALATIVLVAGTDAAHATEIRAASWYPPSHVISTILYGYYAKKADEYSNGSLEVKASLGSALVTPRDAMQSVASGLVDVSVHMGQYTPSQLNVSAALEEVASNYVEVPPAAMIAAIIDFSMHDKEMLAQWRRNGVVYGGPYITDPYKLTCTSKITTLKGLKGKRVRMPNRAMSAFAESAGMIPVSLSANEQYSALDKGVLDCTSATFADIEMRKIYEVTSDAVDLPLTIFWAGFAWAYNPDTWAHLTVPQRRALFRAESAALARFLVPGPLTLEQKAYRDLPKLGVQIHQPGPKLIADLDRFRKKTAKAAPELVEKAYGIKDAGDLYQRFDATVQKWNQRVVELGLTKLSPDNRDKFQKMLDDDVFGKIDLTRYGVQ